MTMNKKLTKEQSEKLANNLSIKDRMVYYTLVGNPSQKMTQKNASNYLGIPASTLSDIARRLLKARAIRKDRNERANVIYSKGINSNIVDAYVAVDLKHGEYGGENHPVVSQKKMTNRIVSFVRTHLNGGWIDIKVMKEGNIDGFIKDGSWTPLFKDCKISKPNGMTRMDSKVYINGDWSSIRYQTGNNTGSKTFGITPTHIKTAPDDLKAMRDDILILFHRRITPFLQELERHAGWVFEKDECGNYQFKGKPRPEFGFDSNITEMLKQLEVEPGRPGDVLYYDTSKAAGDGGEFETPDIDMATALTALPQTAGEVDKLKNEVVDLNRRVGALERKTGEGSK